MPYTASGDKVGISKKSFREMLRNTESTWPEIMIEESGVQVIIHWDCYEGVNGDYDVEDDDDEPLLRFDVLKRTAHEEGDGEFEQIEDSSYCTDLRAYDDRGLILQAAQAIMNEVFDKVKAGQSIKKTCEGLSHIRIARGKVV